MADLAAQRQQYLSTLKKIDVRNTPGTTTLSWISPDLQKVSKTLSQMTAKDWASAGYSYEAGGKYAKPLGLAPSTNPSTGLLPSSPMAPPGVVPAPPASSMLPPGVPGSTAPGAPGAPPATPQVGVPSSAQPGSIPAPGDAASVIDLLRGNTIGDQLGYLKKYGAPLRSAILESFPEFASLDKYYQERMAQPLSEQMTEDFLQNYGRATSMAGWGEYATSPGLPYQAAMGLSALQEQVRSQIAGQYQNFSGNLLGMTGLFNDYTGQYLSYLTAQTQAGLGQSQFQQSLALQQKQFEAELKAAQEQSDLIKQQLTKSEKELEEFKRAQQVANMPTLPQWGPSNMAEGVTTMPGTSQALADLRTSIYSQNIYGWAPAGSGGYAGYW